MYAQVTTVKASPANLDEATHHAHRHVLPEVRQMEGYRGFITLRKRQTGELLVVVLWENEETMISVRDVLSRTRGGIPHPPGGKVEVSEGYEVSIMEVPSPPDGESS